VAAADRQDPGHHGVMLPQGGRTTPPDRVS
jgi:hypothetical protein